MVKGLGFRSHMLLLHKTINAAVLSGASDTVTRIFSSWGFPITIMLPWRFEGLIGCDA